MASRAKLVRMTGSAVIAAGGVTVDGFYVASTTSGKLQFYNRASTGEINVGDELMGQITPAAGWHALAGMHATAGLFVSKDSGTIDVSFFIRETD